MLCLSSIAAGVALLTNHPAPAMSAPQPGCEGSSAVRFSWETAGPPLALSSACSSFDNAAELVATLRRILHVAHIPMHDVVARLDTSGQEWVLYLDSDSPPGDQCWAMFDVLRVLIAGLEAAEWAIPTPRLHLVRDAMLESDGIGQSWPR